MVDMSRDIPPRQQKKLLRLISARADMDYSLKAYQGLKFAASRQDQYDRFLSFVVSYCRPFTENEGLGNLLVEFPEYPRELNIDQGDVRHQRMMDLRHKFLSHSGIHGTKIVLLAPNALDPGVKRIVNKYSCNVARREFLDIRFADWLVEIVKSLAVKLDEMIQELLDDVGPRYLGSGEVRYLPTPADEFEWTPPQSSE
jgi:hypothetical protein